MEVLLTRCLAVTVLLISLAAAEDHLVSLDRGSGEYNLAKPKGVDGKYHWSQSKQDEYVDKYFNQKRFGFFIEIGGFDGESHSNTLFFERKRLWDGLLVEPNPHTYEMLKHKKRLCYSANACISKTHDELTFEVAGGITSSVELMSQHHRKRIAADSHTYRHQRNWKGTGEQVTVKCHSLQHYLDDIGVRNIDYFSLDVEGAEMHILRSLDWTAMNVTLWTIETQESRAKIHAFMVSKGYHRVTRVGQDDVFVRK